MDDISKREMNFQSFIKYSHGIFVLDRLWVLLKFKI